MILSKMLGMIAENRDLLEDQMFCGLVVAAWEDLEFLFYQLHDDDRDNSLWGFKGAVEGRFDELRDTVMLVSSKSHWPLEYRKQGDWKRVQHLVEQLEAGVKEELDLRCRLWHESDNGRQYRSKLAQIKYYAKLREQVQERRQQLEQDEVRIRRFIVEQRDAGLTWERILFAVCKEQRVRHGPEWSLGRIKRAYKEEVAKIQQPEPQQPMLQQPQPQPAPEPQPEQPEPEPDPNELRRWIVEQRDAGLSWYRIGFELRRKKARTCDGRQWSLARIKQAYEEEVAKAQPPA